MEKLITIQTELKAPKNQYNSFGNYNYRNAEDIVNALKPLLATHKCNLTLTDEVVLVGQRYYVKATATIKDLETKETISVDAYSREDENIKGMHQSQITGASSSYARKYALNGLFLIDDTKDADSLPKNEADVKPEEKKKPELLLNSDNFVNCRKAYLKDKTYLPKILSKYEVSEDILAKLTEA